MYKKGADVLQSNVLSGQATLIAGQRQLIDAADCTSGALTKLTDDTNEDKRIREEQSRQLSEILMEMKRKDVSVHEGATKIDFREGDPRLDLSREDTSVLAGSFQGQPVLCLPVSTSQIDSRQGPRLVSIYSKLSANTLVHPFYGIAEREGRLWAVMRDLRHGKVLGLSLNDSDFKELKARLMIAFDIAHTVAYLHAAEILVKNLSDVDVVLIKEKERWKPILTNLERARFVGQTRL